MNAGSVRVLQSQLVDAYGGRDYVEHTLHRAQKEVVTVTNKLTQTLAFIKDLEGDLTAKNKVVSS